jgi:hypothetical protein
MDKAILHRIRTWRHDPIAFVKDCIQVQPSDQQMEGLAAVAKNKRLSIRSGHGTGKDAFASWVIIWFMSTRKDAKVICTAPTARQLDNILWSEISKWLNRSVLKDEFVYQKQKIFHKSNPNEWWVTKVSPAVKAAKEEQAETLAGFHGDHMLIVADEASGIPDPVYIPLEGAMTQDDNRCLLIGNPTKNIGYFADTHRNPDLAKDWTRLHWDSSKSSNVKPEYVDYMKRKYGEQSNVYAIRVRGDFPSEDEKTLIPLAWAQQCVGNPIPKSEDDPKYLGVDVARFGDDYSIILPRQGLVIDPWESFQGMNTISLAAFCSQNFEEMEADGMAIDEIGVGAGVVDWLNKRSLNGVFGINVAWASSDITKFHRLRDELWCRVRDKCMKGIYSFPETLNVDGVPIGNELANELASPLYDFNEHGGIKVESKKDMKKRGIASPNIADALCLTEYFHSIAHKVWNPGSAGKKKKRRREERYVGPHGFQLY